MSDFAHSGMPHARMLTAIADRFSLIRHHRVRFGRNVQLRGRVWIHGGGKVEIRDHSRVDASELPVELHAEREGEIVIGKGVEIGGGTSIEATARVLIGDGARIGRLCKMLDNSFHETRGDWDRRPTSQPIEIGAGAIIGDRAILLPGARVKPYQIVAPGAVVRGLRRAVASSVTPACAQKKMYRPAERGLWERLRNPFRSLEVLVALSRAELLFRREERSPDIRLRGSLRLKRGGTLRIGPRVEFIGGMIPTYLAARPGAKLAIGENCAFNYGGRPPFGGPG